MLPPPQPQPLPPDCLGVPHSWQRSSYPYDCGCVVRERHDGEHAEESLVMTPPVDRDLTGEMREALKGSCEMQASDPPAAKSLSGDPDTAKSWLLRLFGWPDSLLHLSEAAPTRVFHNLTGGQRGRTRTARRARIPPGCAAGADQRVIPGSTASRTTPRGWPCRRGAPPVALEHLVLLEVDARRVDPRVAHRASRSTSSAECAAKSSLQASGSGRHRCGRARGRRSAGGRCAGRLVPGDVDRMASQGP
jgi:hypothetical protein